MIPEYFETVIIGSGFSGLLAAVQLRKSGFDDFLLLERDSEMGGTWQANSYPGAEVDVPTGLYSISHVPYPFRKRYAPQSELLAYTNHIIDRFRLREQCRTGQEVSRLDFDESRCLWLIEVASGSRYEARFVIDASGGFSNPHVPQIEGADSFEGPAFHTARWDHSVDYEGKRVAVIGSGASAAQVVPAIADAVEKLTLFMGSAQWIIPRRDRVYSQFWRTASTWPGIRHIKRFAIFGYHEARFFAFRKYRLTLPLSRLVKNAYARILKKNLRKYIVDDQLRDHMTPDYEMGCRRVIPTNAYLPALARDNVYVEISGIGKITPAGIRTRGGRDIPLDIIVYATGFYVYTNMEKALSFRVYGRDGRSLNDEWAREIASYKGITISGFPNYFKINGPNTGSGHSSQISYMQSMVDYSVKAIRAIKRRGDVRAIDVKADVQRAYQEKTRENLRSTVWHTGGCTAFYRKDMTGEVTGLSPESLVHFILSRKWFRLGDYQLLR